MSGGHTPPLAHRRPLGFRLTLWHSLLFFASALGLLGLTYALFANRAAANERDSIDLRLRLYASEYRRGGVEAVRQLTTLRSNQTTRMFYVRVANSQNRTVFQRNSGNWIDFGVGRLAEQPMPPAGVRTWQTLEAGQRNRLLLAAERLPDGGLLQVGRSNEELNEVLREYRRSALVVLLIFFPASFAGGAFLASRALRPVNDLANVAQGIVDTGRFDARVPPTGTHDELDALVRVFNEMLGRIDALVRGMRESIDNVAHDLRTPLTRLRMKAQHALVSSTHSTRVCTECEPALEALANCVEEAERVTVMLDTVMEIAETQAGLARLNLAPVSLRNLIEDAIAAYAEVAEERDVRVTMDVPDTIRMRADTTALARVFANLIDNAIKFTSRGGRVHIAGTDAGGVAEVRVTDNGIGIPAEDLQRIWERLFRGDRSRSERGLGLGLSFVRAIVEAHGGSVWAESEVGRGTTILMTLPRA